MDGNTFYSHTIDSKSLLASIGLWICLLVLPGWSQNNAIQIGSAVQVSKAQEKYLMREVLVSADPQNPNHLLGCGIAYDESRNREWTVVYVSKDGGNSWKPTLSTDNFEMSGDPACALGRGGLATHMAMAFEKFPPENNKYVLRVYRSTDGGETWPSYTDLPMKFQGIDRESVTIDTSESKYKNQIYVSGTTHVRDFDGGTKGGLAVWTSADGGKSFLGPAKRADSGEHYVLDTGNSAVLSDGTLVTVFGDLKKSDGLSVAESKPGEPNATLLAVRTTDGGESLSQAVKVDDFYMINIWNRRGEPPAHSGPMLAVDSTKGPFKDRLYAIWSDNRDGRGAIRLSYSTSKGKTWSKSVVIDDVPGPVVENSGPDNFQPTVAVNKDGVVLVCWYDRRDNPDGLSWYVRARASLDGGETWLPSVRVSTEPNVFSASTKMFVWANAEQPKAVSTWKDDDSSSSDASIPKPVEGNPARMTVAFSPRQFFAGDYAGLTADAAGTFHAFWIDNRTGLPQIWTAPIRVFGKAVMNGDPSLSAFKDVSSDVRIKIVGNSYDRVSNTLTIAVQLENNSKEVIRGPIKLRLVSLSSPLGNPSVANADNDISNPGAVWDFTPTLKNNELQEKEDSATKDLIFKVDHPLPLLDNGLVRPDLIVGDIRVLASGSQVNKGERP
jgi:hypothetical protein